ncbi:MAG: hypothetical protein DI629_20065 [Mesorhizobium amorphae]|nr:MAG: hypothetical protein DI629_20065 [Mesorhizobium amorphae]
MKRGKSRPLAIPRNPFAIPAAFRKGGYHGKTKKTVRRDDKLALKKIAASLLSVRHGRSGEPRLGYAPPEGVEGETSSPRAGTIAPGPLTRSRAVR